ncbi:Ig-like domain-containing protein, partial [Aliiroseovarius subalbicans]|uniref:Ig-like domain-containing protein n=1 Tax=Aliiroseovarius subalbicans TaxID=2925840 RepID=UPI001F5641B7
MATPPTIDRNVDLGLWLPGTLEGALAPGAVVGITIAQLGAAIDGYAVSFSAESEIAGPKLELFVDGQKVGEATATRVPLLDVDGESSDPDEGGATVPDGTAQASALIYSTGFSFGTEDGQIDLSGFAVGSRIVLQVVNQDPAVALELGGLSVQSGVAVGTGTPPKFDLSPLATYDLIETGAEGFTSASLGVLTDDDEIAIAAGDIEVIGAGEQAAAIASAIALGQTGNGLTDFDWRFDAPLGAFDFLSAGEVVTVSRSFTITVTRTTEVPAADGGTELQTETDTITEQVAIRIVGRNDAPDVIDVALTTDEDTEIGRTLAAFEIGTDDPADAVLIATDADSSTLTFTLLDAPTLGRLVEPGGEGSARASISSGDLLGAFTYVPDADASGLDTFRIKVSDGDGASSIQTFTVDIAAINDAPVNRGSDLDRTVETVTGATVAVSLAGLKLEDVEVAAAGGTLTVSFDTGGAGTIAFNLPAGSALVAGANTLTGTPEVLNAYFAEGGTLSYTDTSGSSPLIVARVTDAGVAGAGGTQTTDLGTIKVDLNATPVAPVQNLSGVKNAVIVDQLVATDAEGDALTFRLAADGAPVGGTVSIDRDGSFFYQPEPGFVGVDTFKFTVTDGRSSADRIVSVAVVDQPDLPTLVRFPINVLEDRAIEGQITVVNPNGGELTFAPVTDLPPALGAFSLSPDGSYSYTPAPDVFGEDQVFFTLSGADLAEPLTLSLPVTIRPEQDAPVAGALAADAVEDQPLSGQLPGTDADGDALSYALPTDGWPENGSVTIAENGAFTYTPAADFFGQDRFSYTVTDGVDTDRGLVTVTVAPVNDAPTIADQTVTLNEDTPLTRSLEASDVDNTPLSATITRAPTLGAAGVNDDGTYSYTPFADVTGTDSFEVTISDGALSDTATINLTILGRNDAPVGADDFFVLREDVAVVLDPAGNDTDVDAGDVLRVVAVGSAAHGMVEVTGNGRVLYTPDADYFGSDSFDYTVADGAGATGTATVTLEVRAQGELPAPGSDGDDVFEVQGRSGEHVAFDGGAGFDVVRNTRDGRDIWLTDA